MALNIMSNLDSPINQTINNYKKPRCFSSVSGVGPKLAVRIVNELCEKLKKKRMMKKLLQTFLKQYLMI